IKKITQKIRDKVDDSRKNKEKELNPTPQKNLIKRIIEKQRKMLHDKLYIGKDKGTTVGKKSKGKKIAENGYFPPRW
ncbi:MAG: hypothetical protein CO136_00245, partial [Candidatus Levybacteria bacterium CG_4_9_14_3_um_filter_36_7]